MAHRIEVLGYRHVLLIVPNEVVAHLEGPDKRGIIHGWYATAARVLPPE